ncbi:MAG TPA: alpha/beta hydrolase [Pseudonocardiaceae bacterium]
MRLDPAIEEFRKQWQEFGGKPSPSEQDMIDLRGRLDAAMATNGRPPRADVEIADVVAGVPVRLYRPAGIEGRIPLHVHFHGGAFILGSAMSSAEDGELAERAAAAKCVVASVEYRLAPEHRFPAGIEDCYQALTTLVDRAAEFSIDPGTVTVGGGSSGGNFAAVVALMAKERGGPQLALQLLEVAGTDLTKSSAAWRNPAPGHDTTRAADLHLIDMYLNSQAERVHRFASPLLYPDLAGAAPAYIMNAEFDPRRDECEAYAVRLRDAGVPAVARTMNGHIHGSMVLPDWPPAIAWREEANTVLAQVNAGTFSWATV